MIVLYRTSISLNNIKLNVIAWRVLGVKFLSFGGHIWGSGFPYCRYWG